jgi:ribosomal protein S12 methylthiotransferase accessory factor YcaO
MKAVRRAEAAGCSQLALTLVRDAAQAAATGESAEQWRAEVEFEQWVEDELRAAGAWPWDEP